LLFEWLAPLEGSKVRGVAGIGWQVHAGAIDIAQPLMRESDQSVSTFLFGVDP